MGLHCTNAHHWVRRFEAGGLSGLQTRPREGGPRLYGSVIEDRVVDVATSRPKDLGLRSMMWSLTKLRDHLRDQEQLPDISHETVRRILHGRGLRFLTGGSWCESDDPDFEAGKGHRESLPPPAATGTDCVFRRDGTPANDPAGRPALGHVVPAQA